MKREQLFKVRSNYPGSFGKPDVFIEVSGQFIRITNIRSEWSPDLELLIEGERDFRLSYSFDEEIEFWIPN